MAIQFNPYVIGTPVSGVAFYGREKLINIVRDTLAIKTVNLLVFFGQRRIGKTSFLQNLGKQATLKDFVFIYSDATELFDKSAYEVLDHFSQKIAQTLDLRAPTKAQLQKDKRLFSRGVLPQAYEKISGRRLVFILDEFDIFERRRKVVTSKASGNGRESALDIIEDLIKNEPALAFIVTLGRGQRQLGSDLTRITRTGHWTKISVLEEDDARRLIVEPARNQLTYSAEAIGAILGLTAGHPFYTQLVCYEIFSELQPKGQDQVEASDVQKVKLIEKVIATGAFVFGWLWEDLSPGQRIVASLIAEAVEGNPSRAVTEDQLSAAFEKNRIHRRGLELIEAPNQLVDLDIIERRGPSCYRYQVEVVRRWVREQHPVSHEREKNLPLLSQRAADEFAKGQLASHPSSAIRHYQEAVAVNPNHIAAQLALAEALLGQNQIDAAVEVCEAAFWLDPSKATKGLEKAKAAQPFRPSRPKLTLLWAASSVMLIGILLALFVWTGLPSHEEDKPTPTEVITRIDHTPTAHSPLTPWTTEEPTPGRPTEPTATLAEEPTQELNTESTTTPTRLPTQQPTTKPTAPTIQVEIQKPTSELTSLPTQITTQEPTRESTAAATQVPPSTSSRTSTPHSLASTPTLGYHAPILLSPEAKAAVPESQEVILKWNPVGTLAENERYAIRLIFMENGKQKWDGDQVQSTSWVVPRDFLNRVDGPEFKFEWFVFVEKVDENGQTVQISPNSETRVFYWWRQP